MSADRYEIIYREKPEFVTAECSIEIRFGNRSLHLFSGCSFLETHIAGAIRQQARDLDQLRTDLAAAVSENAAILSANRDLKAHFDALKGDYDEAAHFARHFTRDDAAITPRGAIIRLGDKCTDLFVRLQQAEARLAAIEAAPTVAVVSECAAGLYVHQKLFGAQLAEPGAELIYRPAKDQT